MTILIKKKILQSTEYESLEYKITMGVSDLEAYILILNHLIFPKWFDVLG